jgi:phospholipid-binding lipoprotein MlaA
MESPIHEAPRADQGSGWVRVRGRDWIVCGWAAAFTAIAAGARPSEAPGLALAPSPETTERIVQYDPWQKFNRGSFAFSMGLDHVILAPIAHVYVHIAPLFIRRRVGSVLDNFGEPTNVINHLAQGHAGRALETLTRFIVNSTVGLGGLFDVAGKTGLPEQEADFGQTLGRWGAEPGPYLFVPIIGPSNIRDGLGRIVDSAADPVSRVAGGITTAFGASRTGAIVVDRRADADPTLRALDDATDPYATTRSAYNQNRDAFIRSSSGREEALPDFDAAQAPP